MIKRSLFFISTMLIFYSQVNGQTLSITSTPAPIQGSLTGKEDVYPSLYRNSAGKLFLIYQEGLLGNIAVPMWVILKTSTDNGATWNNYAGSTVAQLHITNIGSGYSSTPSCAFSGGGGSNATCTAAAPVNGAIPSISITAAGTGYNVCCGGAGSNIYGSFLGNVCTISGGGGSGATCLVHADASDGIVYATMTAYGSGYTSTPSCTITGAGTGATCTVGAPVNGAITSYTITNPGSGYTSAPTLSVSGGGGSNAAVTPTLNYCMPADPPGCLFHVYDNDDIGVGAGFTPAGTFVVMITDQSADEAFGLYGIYVMRSTDNGLTWSTPTLLSTPQFPSSPVAYVSGSGQIWAIPSGSPGVTGSCSTGCLIKSVQVGNTEYDIIFSYDDGVTWRDSKKIVSQNGYADENAISWIGGNKLIDFIRPSRTIPGSGGPTPVPFVYSSDMGTTWTSTCGDPLTNASSCVNGPQTLTPVQPLCPAGYVYSQDEFVWPMSMNAPAADYTTLFFGERFGCHSGSTFISHNYLRTVTFKNTTVFNTQIFPSVQMLYDVDLANPSAFGANRSYGYMVTLGGGNVLIVFENPIAGVCGSMNCEQIWQMTASYNGGSMMSSGLKLTSGVIIQ